MPHAKSSFKIALLIALIALNALIVAMLSGWHLPARVATSEPKAPQAGHSVYLPAIAREGQGLFLSAGPVWYVEAGESPTLHLVGEISNQTSTALSGIVLRAELVTAPGKTPLSFTGTLPLTVLPPNEKTCFNLYTTAPTDFSAARVRVLSYATEGAEPPALQAQAATAGFDRSQNWYHLSGSVANPEGLLLNNLKVVATLYDPAGQVLGCQASYATFSTENPSQPASFNLFFMDRDYSQVSGYRLQTSAALP